MAIPDYFQFQISDSEQTDLPIISLIDNRTGFVVRTAVASNTRQTPSIMAFAGARYSRSSDSAESIFSEIKSSGKNAQEKLAAIFRNYGHASVADMSQLFGYIENIPQEIATKFFYETSVGGGQERSTRYQDFSAPKFLNLIDLIDPNQRVEALKYKDFEALKTDFLELQKLSLEKYEKWVKLCTEKYIKSYQVDINNKQQQAALTARVFDTARYFLLFGVCNKTSLGWITSAREWARIISQFKSSNIWQVQALGEQIEYLFAPEADVAESLGYLPEAPDLIRYTKSDETTISNLSDLRIFLESQTNFLKKAQFNQDFGFKAIKVEVFDEKYTGSLKAVAQNIMTLYPAVNENWLFSWLLGLDTELKTKFGLIVNQRFNHHKQMGNQFRVNVKSFLLTCSIAEARDLNRHRAWGRFIPMLSSENDQKALLEEGYTLPLYLTQNPDLKAEKIEFESDLLNYYDKLKIFISKAESLTWFSSNLILELLPFAHIMKIWLHGSPKEISYMTKLRVRPGGHINYRVLAYEMARQSELDDPFMAGTNLDLVDTAPDSLSREQFLDRS